MRFILVLTLSTTPALADYSEHSGVTMFTEQPCSSVIEILDSEETSLGAMPILGMTWGFILGYDTAAGGLQGDEDTTLLRLRKTCAEDPNKPAAEILESFR